ncbi:MAG: DMT family transporter [Anaerolineae bacterium]|jgi:drug/metabolite transporter (DMT)-like permease
MRTGSVMAASPRRPAWHYAMLLAGILAVSTSSILIRLADAPPLVVGTWRLLLATLFLTPWALPSARREWRALSPADRRALAGSGVALAIHFIAWIYSLSMTTVASSTMLVSTNPIFVGLATRYILRERVSRTMVLAIGLTLLGSAIVGYGDINLSPMALLGDGLALLGAVAGSAYILLGQTVRKKVSTLTYIWPCYGLAGTILLLVSLAARQPLLHVSPATTGVFVLLALVPQILGHSAFNWALGHFRSLLVTVALLGEPVGATLLAWLVLSEPPASLFFLGGPLILAGIFLAALSEQAGAADTVSEAVS